VLPVTVTEKLAFPPTFATWFVGWVVILGATYTGVVITAALLLVLGSEVDEDTVTEFVSTPSRFGLTVRRILLVLPAARESIEQVIALPRLMHPGDAETKVTLLGKESVTAIFEAPAGPGLEMVRV
jgi:hypothetical protein